MDQAKMERLLRLLMMLSSGVRYSIKELESKFELSERSVFRYLDTLEKAGFVLDKQGNTYALQADINHNKRLNHLLHFTDEEAYVFYSALSEIKDLPNKEQLLRKLDVLYDFKALSKTNYASLETIQSIKHCIDHKLQCKLVEYRSSNSKSIRDRIVEPFSFRGDYVGVWCLDTEDGQCKQFKTCRIKQVEVLNNTWKYSPKHRRPFTDIFRISSDKAYCSIDLSLSLAAYNLLIEEFPTATKYLFQEENGSYRLQAEIGGFSGVGRFILGLPGEITIHAPAELLDYVKHQAAKL